MDIIVGLGTIQVVEVEDMVLVEKEEMDMELILALLVFVEEVEVEDMVLVVLIELIMEKVNGVAEELDGAMVEVVFALFSIRN